MCSNKVCFAELKMFLYKSKHFHIMGCFQNRSITLTLLPPCGEMLPNLILVTGKANAHCPSQKLLKRFVTIVLTLDLSLSFLFFFFSLYLLPLLSLLPVGDSADQPPPYFDPLHHVRVVRGHASSGEPPQRHRLQLRPREDQRHGKTHAQTHTRSHACPAPAASKGSWVQRVKVVLRNKRDEDFCIA